MPTFQEVGFLGDEWPQFRENIRAAHADAFELADAMNVLVMKELWALPMTNLTEAKAYAVTCFARSVQNFQTAIILCERGAQAEARTLVRAMAETIFLTYGFYRKPDMTEKLLEDHAKHCKGHANAMIELGRKRGLDASKHEEMIAHIEAEYPRAQWPNGPQSIKWGSLAEEMGLGTLYQLAYRQPSGDAAHASLESLQRHIMVDADGNLESFDFNPRDADVRTTLKAGMAGMVQLFNFANAELELHQFNAELTNIMAGWLAFIQREQARAQV